MPAPPIRLSLGDGLFEPRRPPTKPSRAWQNQRALKIWMTTTRITTWRMALCLLRPARACVIAPRRLLRQDTRGEGGSRSSLHCSSPCLFHACLVCTRASCSSSQTLIPSITYLRSFHPPKNPVCSFLHLYLLLLRHAQGKDPLTMGGHVVSDGFP